MELSFSQLAEYAECPRRYYYRYVQGRSLPKQSEEMAIGSAFHDLLKFIFSSSLFRPSQQEIEARLRSLLSGKLGAEKMDEIMELGKKVITNLLQEDPSNIFEIEFPFSLSLGEHTIRGRMDRVDKYRNGEVEIIEYKLHGGGRWRNNLQLALYHLAAENLWHPPAIKLTIASFVDNKKESYYLKEEEVIEGRERIIHLASGIERGDFTPLRAEHCFKCPFFQVCFKEIPPERESLL